MLLEEFLDPKILIVAGKGGVGRSTVAAALAVVAARQGRRVCVTEVDPKGTLARLFGSTAPSYQPSELSPGVWGLSILPEQALAEYLEVQYHIKRISRVFTSTHFLDYITTAAPGLKDILVLGKIWYLEQNRAIGQRHGFDTIIVDAPAAGHMLSFLSAPMGLSDAVRLGPVRRQADWLVDMLRDPKRSRVHLVTLAEEMPVAETLETSHALEKRLKLQQGPVFANGIYPALFSKQQRDDLEDGSGETAVGGLIEQGAGIGLKLDDEDVDALVGYRDFLEARRAIQARYLRRLKKETPQPVITLPFLFSAGLALPDVETLADVVEAKVATL